MATLNDVNTVKTVFLNGEALIRGDYIASGELESYGVRFRLFGRGKIEAIELLYASPEPPSADLKDAVTIIARHVCDPFANHLNVYFDLDEERFLLNLILKDNQRSEETCTLTESASVFGVEEYGMIGNEENHVDEEEPSWKNKHITTNF
ncbi:hypothetical protein [Salisediminibacterium selenitireducens]|uniref:Uncharacterized protein n=1 Tax=Bacillus selenitireducens (strain ATCC 700615 / DSM 15326 / MLS10) TaxID=439292 RepID=D6XXX0_BACIE|nr:hypothetical protein [Salisediminibacterium selenitireducens]ADI00163.1 hypothetical protein Bsel_2663 [[Bacillus] selenitireducens MLS10]